MDPLVGAGYSFTQAEGYFDSHTQVAKYVRVALVQFYKLFAELRNNHLYIAGDAGKYIPALAHEIHVVNGEPNTFKIPLRGMTIGNGLLDPENQLDYAIFLHAIGLIDRRERLQLEQTQNRIKHHIRSGNWTEAADQYDSLKADIRNMTGEISPFDYNRDTSDTLELMRTFEKFITADEIRKRIHVGRTTYESEPKVAMDHLRKSFGQSVRPLVDKLLEHYPVMFCNGQMDMAVPHSLTENLLSNLHWTDTHRYNVLAAKQKWYVGDDDSCCRLL